MAGGHDPEAVLQGAMLGSFFGGGYECSTFHRRSGERMDFIAATHHEQFAQLDYERLRQEGLGFAREGLRWHLVEQIPGKYDFSSAVAIVEAALKTQTQVVWDLCHFGWPDHIDLFKPEFVSALAAYGAAFASWLESQTGEPGWFVPVNEISYFSWASGDEGSMYPFVTGRGLELKTQLVRAAIRTMDAIWGEAPASRFLHVDPLIHVAVDPCHPEEQGAADAYRESQFQAWDMLAGRLWPELGGKEKYLELLGVNFYPYNQWFYNLKGTQRIRKFRPLTRRHPRYRPFRDMLNEVWERYRRPLLVAETGAEDRARASWLRYVCQEVEAALALDVPLQGICLFPIVNHPGWVDDRHCHDALWDYADERGNRAVFKPLEKELGRWRRRLEPDRSKVSRG